ncbi:MULTISPECIES: ATP-binding cassette domain-containing protein [unclassified Frondihabitans]|uniref:ATP-binding cassette domain-containing protein n=1 Tax=unclassified Frondihabitans TaxID=2626248 RepID=UPI000FBC1C72|nr:MULTISPECIES: ATP-binding cassette domain-containing protein [unclassified Frondihabitans]RPE76383.1 ABC-type multidrug transport system ATPase subunit [Frondihabitans sp. PhB153]RPF05341.1 ABC-type multidrug transport system ATPase subunit [Frondihabitans sp. PhB161]
MSNTEGADGGVAHGQGDQIETGGAPADKAVPVTRTPAAKRTPASPGARKPTPKRAPATARTAAAAKTAAAKTTASKPAGASRTTAASKTAAAKATAAKEAAAKVKAEAAKAAADESEAVAGSDSIADEAEPVVRVTPARAPRASAATRRRTSPSQSPTASAETPVVIASPEPEAPAELQVEPEPDEAPEADATVAPIAEDDPETEVDETPLPESDPSADAARESAPVVLSIKGLVKRYGTTTAVENIDLDVHAGSFYGIVGPNGAGKTTTLSIATGLLRPDEGTVTILGDDVWSAKESSKAKRSLGVLPDRLRLFDRLTGAQFLYYAGTLRGLDGATARKRTADLAEAFGLQDALGRLVMDYSVGMTKKVALAAAIIHSPRLLILDEPFESVDPVSAATVTEILQRYVRGGGTVLLSSHSMDLVERICDSVAVIVDGHVLAQGTVHDVRAGRSLQERFVDLAGGGAATEGMEWLHSFSD